MRKRLHEVGQKQDLLGLAGWMYADLFLALMVIFLATVSFIPKVPIPTSFNTLEQKSHAQQTATKTMSQVYSGFNLKQLEGDILQFETANGLPPNAVISYVQIVGGYDSNLEAADQGAMRALIFGLKMSSSDPIRFSKIGANLDSSATLAPGSVKLSLTFGGTASN